MRNLYRFIVRNHVIFLFIILEIISFIFVFNFNNFQKSRFLNSSDYITGNIYSRYSRITDYFQLSAVNRKLAEENARLRKLAGIPKTVRFIPDTLRGYQNSEMQYSYISARIISNTVNKQQNYLTLDKGSKDGVKPDMGLICADGVVGVITNVTPSFSTAMSLLNVRWNISAKIAKNNYFGTLVWNGMDYQRVFLNDIPFHVDVSVGDTIVTSGFSSLFPEGIRLGTVEKINKEGGTNFYTIIVKLFIDYKSLTYVEVIENNKRKELDIILRQNSGNENLD
jgi:rod shape-determining protein MreC